MTPRQLLALSALAMLVVGTQTLRYPLVRVARVVSSTDVVDWSGPALALCMRAGISITWLDAKGQAIGSIYPLQRTHTPLGTALELWTESTEGPTRYQNWLRSRRMDVLVRWGEAQTITITPQLWENTKREWVYGKNHNQHLPLGLRSLCLAYVAAQLGAGGLTPQLWGPRLEVMDLDEDLCELLWAEMNLGSGPLADNAEEAPALTTLFERWSNRNASALALHLASLHRTALKALHS